MATKPTKAQQAAQAKLSAATGIPLAVIAHVAANPPTLTAAAAAAAPAAPAPAATNPFAALVAAPTAATVTGVKAQAAKVLATLAPNAVNSVGVPVASLAPSLAAKGTNNPAYPANVLAHTYTLGTKLQGGACPATSPHNIAAVHMVQRVLATPATATALHTAGVPWHSLAAYLKRGWVVKA